MGLDVYLRKCADLNAAEAAERAAETETEQLWEAVGGYDKATEAQKEEIRAKSEEIAKRHGLSGLYGRHSSILSFDGQPSKTDPEHYFKIGYFRSSYNPSGINSVMRRLGLPGLYEIFGVEHDEYNVRPDWEASLARVNDAIARYEAHLASALGRFNVMEARPMHEFGAVDEKAALALFSEELRKHAERAAKGQEAYSYSNRDGEFFLDKPLKVHAVITKTFKPGSGNAVDRLINRPTVFVVYEKPDADKPDYYLTALKIVRETIEFVLAQPDKQHFYMAWSG